MVVLGPDSAWTVGRPSGVALVAGGDCGWQSLCVAPSYDTFVGCAAGGEIDWSRGKFLGTAPQISGLLKAARSIAGTKPTLVAVDMPISRTAIRGRRPADDAISVEFGGRYCSTHSPTAERPGLISAVLMHDLAEAGFPLATTDAPVGETPAVLEVYPHPALLDLVGSPCRVPYKVSRSRVYWPGATVKKRIENLLEQFAKIGDALRRIFGDTQIPLPEPSEVSTLSHLKRFEDALDALISAWVGLSGVPELAGRNSLATFF
ncbi:MAG: DUF429 domain-containing protein [Terriglobales bacterium]